MIVFGIVITFIGLLFIVSFAISRVTCKTRIEATVSKLATKTIKLRGTTVVEYTPVFTYTVNGKEYTYKAEMSTIRKNRFSVGQKAFVFINETRPNEARYGSNLGILLFGLVCFLIGAIFIVLSFI